MIPLERSLVRVGLALGLSALTALPAAASRDESYGYFRVIEGSATLMQADGERQPAEINQPVLAGDRIWVPERSRAEVVLADRNILRIDGGSEVTLEQLAASPDRDDPATVLRLQDGNVLLTVTSDSLGDQLPRVDTPNATIYTQNFGTYRITATDQLTELVVRRGKAEVVTDRGSQIVKADEAAFIEGERYADIEVESATSYDALERWADKLEGEARYADNDYIDDDLRYHAAPLARHGSWIHHGGRPYWRPRVDAGWRPYWQGRWAYTPAGLTWVSYEPWGWVPYHYGSWDFLPGYGWAWAPGRQWAPAHVYWYWGPTYAGWCPTGYYTSFYRNRYPYFRSGVYGWAGGSWDHYSHWSFISHDYFRGYRNGYRDGYKDARRDHWDVRRYAVPRDQVRRAGPLERGVITTDTRPLRPETWNEPRQAIRVLTDQPVTRRLERGDGTDPRGGELPDVTPFIQRRTDLPDNVVRTVVPRDGDRGDQAGTRPRVSDGRPGGGTPWEGGVISTDPSDRSRSGGATPRVRTPNEGSTQGNTQGNTPSAERPRVGRPQPGQGGGAPRPDNTDADRNERGSTPRVRVPETPQQGGSDAPRARRPEAGSPGGAPRPEARQPRQDEGDRNDEVRSRRPDAGSPGGSPRPRQPESEAPAVRRPDPPRSYDAPRSQDRERQQQQEREQEQQMRERAREREQQQEREQEMRARTQERERQQEREREVRREREQQSPPQSYSRPSRPERQEEARPPERERGGSRESESRGRESSGGSGRSSSSRGSRSRPPGE